MIDDLFVSHKHWPQSPICCLQTVLCSLKDGANGTSAVGADANDKGLLSLGMVCEQQRICQHLSWEEMHHLLCMENKHQHRTQAVET